MKTSSKVFSPRMNCRVDGQGFGFVLPDEADKLREFFAEHQDKPALEKSIKRKLKIFVVCLTYG